MMAVRLGREWGMRAVRATRRRRGRAGLAAGVVGALVLGATAALAASAGASVTNGTATGAAKEPVAKLAISADTVEIKRKDADDFKKAKDGASLREGDTVRTDATGHAEIQYGDDAYTRLDVDTTFRIDSLTDDQGNRQVQGSLEKGQTWNRTVALTESESFEQTGADATAAVEGTAFAVSCDTVDHCVFTAIVHNIQLTGADNEIKLLTPLDECDSESGDLCGDISKISPEDLPAWITDNLLRDLLERGIDDGPLTGTVVVQGSSVTFVHSPPAESPPAATAPGAPTGVSALGGDGVATVTFSPPASDGGSPITSYTVTGSGGASSASVSASVAASATGADSPIVVSGLENGVTYTFTVTATNAVGTGPSSAPSNAVTPATTPGAPSQVHAVTAGYDAASVSFVAPDDDGGAPITGYAVVASTGGSCTTLAPVTVCTVTGLPNAPATFTVTATNAAGTGPASGASNAITPPVILPQGTWLVAPSTPATGWEQPEYDDSSWSEQPAPFRDPGSPVACPAFPAGASPFPINGQIYVRQTFELPDGATGVMLLGTIDNRAYVYINGHLVNGGDTGGSFFDGFCHADGIDAAVPDAYLVAGVNVVAVHALDEGAATYFDLTIAFAPPAQQSDVGAAAEEPEPTTTTTTPAATEPSTDTEPPA